jgi:fused signal recognition particle receptor
LGSADTFRAAAIEQLEVWAARAGVEMVTRERGADPASVCYDTIERAEATGADLVLIDTAGRLHTSADLMRELEKVVSVVRKRSQMPVYTVLVIDATTGQNGMQQAREFNRALELDALIVTKLDGTAKGGIALAISHELGLPIIKIGVGEGIDDLRDFNAKQYVSALIGDFEEGDEFAEGDTAEVDLAADSPDVEGVTGEVAAAEDEPEAEEVEQVTPSPNEAADTQERPSMTWDEFCAMEDAQPKKKKKHFWEKW